MAAIARRLATTASLGVLAAGWGGAPPAFAEGVEWTRAFLVGSLPRETGSTEGVTVRGNAPVSVAVVLEGERAGLPVYCTEVEKLRIRGRPIPGA